MKVDEANPKLPVYDDRDKAAPLLWTDQEWGDYQRMFRNFDIAESEINQEPPVPVVTYPRWRSDGTSTS